MKVYIVGYDYCNDDGTQGNFIIEKVFSVRYLAQDWINAQNRPLLEYYIREEDVDA